VKHASDAALDQLADVLEGLRKQSALTERKRGVFYRRSSAFIHFHEDPTGLFADVKAAAGWERLPVTTGPDRKAFIARVKHLLANERTR
jgi:hypothetical protein